MQITVNGQALETADALSGEQLLEQLRIPAGTAVAEVNGEHVPRSVFLQRQLTEGDAVELVSLVGGG